MSRISACLNCSTPIRRGPYCENCGQRNVHERIDIAELYYDLTAHILEFNLPWLYTMWQMLVRPAAVCRDYVAGKRVIYVNPLKYLFYLSSLSLIANQFMPQRYRLIPLDPSDLARLTNTRGLDPISAFFANNPTALVVLLSPLIAFFFRVMYARSNFYKSEIICCLLYTFANGIFVYFSLNLLFEAVLDYVLEINPLQASYQNWFMGKVAVIALLLLCHTIWAGSELFQEAWYVSALKTFGITFLYGLMFTLIYYLMIDLRRGPIPLAELREIVASSLVEQEQVLLANPQDGIWHVQYGMGLLDAGRSREGLYELLLAKEQNARAGWQSTLTRAYLQTDNLIFAASEIPNIPDTHMRAVMTLLLSMHTQDRNMAVLAAGELEFNRDAHVAIAQYWRDNNLDSMREELWKSIGRDGLTELHIAWAWILGDQELARRLLLNEGHGFLGYYWMPAFADLRKTTEFKLVMREIGLYEYWTTTGNWADQCRPLGDDDFECF